MLKFQVLRPKRNLVRLWMPIPVIVAALFAAAAPAAIADTVTSSNWAGYAVHRAGIRFKKVAAAWTQPTATLHGGQARRTPRSGSGWAATTRAPTRSSRSAPRSTARRRARSTRPSGTSWSRPPSQTIKMRVRPGDGLYATVAVTGNKRRSDDPRRDHPPLVPEDAPRVGGRRLLGRVDRRGAVGLHQRQHLSDAPARELRLRDVRLRPRPVGRRPSRHDL